MVRYPRFSGLAARRLPVAVAVAVVASSATASLAVDGTWIQPAGGTYSDAANWQSGIVATDADATANFNTVDVTTVAPVTLTSDLTIGNFIFGDTDTSTAGGWQLTGNTITFAGANPTITTNALAVGSTARIDNVIASTATNLTITGPGTLHLTGNNAYTASTTLNNGNLRLGASSTFNASSLGAIVAGTTAPNLILSGTNTITNGNNASGTMFIGNNIVANAGSTTTFNLGTRSSIGQNGSTAVRNVTGTGNLIFNLGTNVSRNDFLANFTAFAGNITFDGQTVLGTDGVTQVQPNARLMANGGNFGAGFTNAAVTLAGYATLTVNTNSGGNTINFGSLSGTSNTAGFLTPSAGGAATLSIGGLNTNTSFAGLFVGNNIVTKVGTGTLTLTSSQYNTNSTNINAGTLALSGSGDLPLSPTINIANGATFDVSGMSSGAYKIHGNAVANVSAVQTLQSPAGSTATVKGNLDLSEGTAVLQPGTVTGASTLNVTGNLNLAGGILNMELSPNSTPGGTNDLLNVSGTTTLGGNLQLNLGLIGGLGTGTYTLLQSAGGVTGSTSGWTVNFGARGTPPSLIQTANALQINVTGGNGASLVFTGAAGNGNWDVNATTNWRNTATNAADKFFQLDTVRFDDTAATNAVTIVGSVAPTAAVVDTTNGYTFSGSGAIVGSGTLTKRGTGTLTISNTGVNSYSGGTTIEAGLIDIGTLGQNGIGTGTITLAGGNLRAITPTGGNITLANAINVTGNSTLTAANSGTTARQTILGGAITGTGTLNIVNDNQASAKGIDIANTGGFTGSLVINDGLAARFSSSTSGNAGMALTINGTGSVGTIISTAAVIPLGSLSGNGTLRGHSSSGGGSTVEYQIGGLNTNTTFSGTIVDGAQGTTVRPVLITKVGTGTLTFSGANTYTGNTTIKAGTLVLSSAASGPVLGNATVTTPAGADIQKGKLVLSYADAGAAADPATQVQSLLAAGYGQTTKFSTGLLRSTTIDSTHLLGWSDDTINSNVTVAYTLAGDANVDLSVGFSDLLALARNYGGSGKVWSQGDFNYDSAVNFTDLLALARNYGQTVTADQQAQLGASFSADFALAQSLAPEPATLSALGMGAIALLGRRRRGNA